MWILLAFFVSSLALSLVMTPWVRAFARRYGLIDKPDQRRKLHGESIPVAGGIAVLLASLITLAIFLGADWCPWSSEFVEHPNQWLGMAAAAIIIAMVGVLDDWGHLSGRRKLLGQLIAVSLLISTGPDIKSVHIAGYDLELGIFAIPFTAFFMLGAINSLNLLDGMDGLLSTVGLITTLAFAGMAVMSERWAIACVAVTLAGALLGFLRYNFPPASIYLGDTGSMLIGLVIGALAINSSLKTPATVALAAPLAILAIPILDTLAAILRRKLMGRSIYTTDRGHLHHCLLDLGFSKVTVLLLISCFCLLAALGAYLSITLKSEWLAVAAAMTIVAILVGMRWFGHGELLLISDRFKNMALSLLQRHGSVRPQDSSIQLQGKGAWTDPWTNLTQAAETMTLKTLRLDINAPALHESYHGRWVDPCDENAESGDNFWTLALPLKWQGQTVGRLEASGSRDDLPELQKFSQLMELVSDLEEVLIKIGDDAGITVVEPISRTYKQPKSAVVATE